MKNLAVLIIIGSICFFSGIWYGYDKGVKNQIYFDAPAKITLYNAYLEGGSPADYMEGEIKYQVGLLDAMPDDVATWLLRHPIHTGVEEQFLEYKPKVESLVRVQMARKELSEYLRLSDRSD